jgi:virginiamycin B lyase
VERLAWCEPQRLRGLLATASIAAVLVGAGCGGSTGVSADGAGSSRAHLYWIGPGGVGRANADGTGVSPRYMPVAVTPNAGLAVAGKYLYWTDQRANAVMRIALNGTRAVHRVVGEAGGEARVPGGLAIMGGYVYWADLNDHAIGRAELSGRNIERSFISDGEGFPTDVAAADGSLYWDGDGSTGSMGRADASGAHVNLRFIQAGSGAATSSVNLSGPLAVTLRYVYWTNRDPKLGSSSSIGRASVDGSEVNPEFITGLSETSGIAVDGSHVYWSTHGGQIGRANLDGSGVERNLVSGLGEVHGLAVG